MHFHLCGNLLSFFILNFSRSAHGQICCKFLSLSLLTSPPPSPPSPLCVCMCVVVDVGGCLVLLGSTTQQKEETHQAKIYLTIAWLWSDVVLPFSHSKPGNMMETASGPHVSSDHVLMCPVTVACPSSTSASGQTHKLPSSQGFCPVLMSQCLWHVGVALMEQIRTWDPRE